jgi:hypothetical protein
MFCVGGEGLRDGIVEDESVIERRMVGEGEQGGVSHS